MKNIVPVPLTRSAVGRKVPIPFGKSRPHLLERLLVQVVFFQPSMSFLMDPCFPDDGVERLALDECCWDTRFATSFLWTRSKARMNCAFRAASWAL